MQSISPSPIAHGLGIALLLWSVPLGAALLVQSGLSTSSALFAAHLLGALALGARHPRCDRLAAECLGAGLLLGFASFPAWIAATAGLGLELGLPLPDPIPPGAGTPLAWVTSLVLAPLFEELGYRGRLLRALERGLGSLPAIGLSSLLFALPHLEPWSVTVAFAVGLCLGALAKLSGSIALCIGVHAGLNLGSLLRGVPPLPG